jgi:hypothetical protein
MGEPIVAIAVCSDEVKCAVATEDEKYFRTVVAEWSEDPNITEIVRVPLEVARRFLFEKWPGRDAAIAAVAESSDA